MTPVSAASSRRLFAMSPSLPSPSNVSFPTQRDPWWGVEALRATWLNPLSLTGPLTRFRLVSARNRSSQKDRVVRSSSKSSCRWQFLFLWWPRSIASQLTISMQPATAAWFGSVCHRLLGRRDHARRQGYHLPGCPSFAAAESETPASEFQLINADCLAWPQDALHDEFIKRRELLLRKDFAEAVPYIRKSEAIRVSEPWDLQHISTL